MTGIKLALHGFVSIKRLPLNQPSANYGQYLREDKN